MKYKHIEATREVRLWITQIVVPITTTIIASGIAIPEVRNAFVNKCNNVKKTVNKKLKKKEQKEKDIVEHNLDDNVVSMFNTKTGEYRMRRL